MIFYALSASADRYHIATRADAVQTECRLRIPAPHQSQSPKQWARDHDEKLGLCPRCQPKAVRQLYRDYLNADAATIGDAIQQWSDFADAWDLHDTMMGHGIGQIKDPNHMRDTARAAIEADDAADESSSRPRSFRIDDDRWFRMLELTAQNGDTITNVLVGAIDAYIEQNAS